MHLEPRVPPPPVMLNREHISRENFPQFYVTQKLCFECQPRFYYSMKLTIKISFLQKYIFSAELQTKLCFIRLNTVLIFL